MATQKTNVPGAHLKIHLEFQTIRFSAPFRLSQYGKLPIWNPAHRAIPCELRFPWLALSMLIRWIEGSEVTKMTSPRMIFKRLIPIALGAAMVVLAMPMTAMANNWTNHQAAVRHDIAVHNYALRHDAAVHRYDNDLAARRAYVPNYAYAPRRPVFNAYAPTVPTYGPYAGRYGYGGCGNVTRMQNVYRQDLATGHPAAANDVARQMRSCGAGGYPYAQNVFGNFPRLW
jgi:hypothetical protein